MTNWSDGTETKFNQLIEKIPFAMRGIAKKKVFERAIRLAQEDNSQTISEKNMVDAFFAETPGGFQGPLKCDMEDIGLDYTQYGYEKDEWKSFFGGNTSSKKET